MAACHRCQAAVEPGDLRCAVCGLAVPVAAAPAGPVVSARVLRCEACAAAVAYVVEAQAPRCAFCGAVARVEQLADPVEQAQGFLPFDVDAARAQQALRHWLGSRGFFRPPTLGAEATVQSLKPLWWPGWVFDANALVSWAADTNVGAHRSAWAPHAGQLPYVFDNVLVAASRGLTSAECAQLAPSYDLRRRQAEPVGPPEALVERFEAQRSAARRQILETVGRAATGVVEGGVLGAVRKRKVHTTALLRGLVTTRLAFPAWVLAYRYRDRLYRAVVSGGNPACVFGDAPLSWLRVLLVVGGSLALLALVILIVVLAQS